MALGIENKIITLQYIGEPERDGGRAPISLEKLVPVYWDEDFSKVQDQNRLREHGIQAKVVIIHEPALPKPLPNKARVKDGATLYRIITVNAIPSGFGLDNSFILEVALMEVLA